MAKAVFASFRKQKPENESAVKNTDLTTADAELERDITTPPERHFLFWSLTIGWLGLLLLIMLTGYVSWSDLLFPKLSWFPLTKGHIAFAFAAIWFVNSIEIVGIDEVGAVELYGLPMIKTGRGPKVLAKGLFQLRLFSGKVEETQFPDEPEFIQKTDDKQPLEEVEYVDANGDLVRRKKVRPIRITSAEPTKEELAEGGILNTQMTLELTFWIRWIIVDPFDLIVNAGDATSVIKQMRDVGESTLNNYVTQHTPKQLIKGSKELETALMERIAESVRKWGVKVVGAGMTAIDLNHEVASELRNVAKVKAVAEQTRIAADAEAYKLEQEGKGRGAARAAELAGEGRGYKEAGELIGVEPREVLAAQVARDTVGEADLVLGSEGIAQVVGLGKKILERKE